MAVGILDVVIDFLDQFLHTAKRSPAKSSLRDAIEPDLHLIEPEAPIGLQSEHEKSLTCRQQDDLVPIQSE